MSVNTAHANDGVLLHSGEYILLYCKNTSIQFVGSENPLFQDCIPGHTYLTSNRIIFRSRRQTEILRSLSGPFILLSDIELQQPAYMASYIRGKVHAQRNGNFTGEVKFRLTFKSGGAIEFFQALMCAASIAISDSKHEPPAYTPARAWYEAPVDAYCIREGFYDWLPTHDAFTHPTPNSIFMTDNPPPFPGIGRPPLKLKPFAFTSRNVRCPTSYNSCEGIQRMTFCGRIFFSPKDGVFPRYIFLPDQKVVCCIKEISDTKLQFSSYEEDSYHSMTVEDVYTARSHEQFKIHNEETHDFQGHSPTFIESSDKATSPTSEMSVKDYITEIADVQTDNLRSEMSVEEYSFKTTGVRSEEPTVEVDVETVR